MTKVHIFNIQRARRIAELSKSRLVKVGAVLKADGGVFGCYNGFNQSGELEYEEAGELVSYPWVIHAEEACIATAAEKGYATKGSVLYVTTSPCFRCARLIAAAGVKEVYYADPWWDAAVIPWLELQQGVTVTRVKDS